MATNDRRPVMALAVVLLATVALGGCGTMKITCQDRIRDDGSVRRKLTYFALDEGTDEGENGEDATNEKGLREEFRINRLDLPSPDDGWLRRVAEYHKAPATDGGQPRRAWTSYACGDFADADLPMALHFQSPGAGAMDPFEITSTTRIDRGRDRIRYAATLDFTAAYRSGIHAFAGYIVDLGRMEFGDIAPAGFREALEVELTANIESAMQASPEEPEFEAATLQSVRRAFDAVGGQLPDDFDRRVRAVLARAEETVDDKPATPEAKLQEQYSHDCADLVSLLYFYELRWQVTMPWPITSTNGTRIAKNSVKWVCPQGHPPTGVYEMTAEARKPK